MIKEKAAHCHLQKNAIVSAQLKVDSHSFYHVCSFKSLPGTYGFLTCVYCLPSLFNINVNWASSNTQENKDIASRGHLSLNTQQWLEGRKYSINTHWKDKQGNLLQAGLISSPPS